MSFETSLLSVLPPIVAADYWARRHRRHYHPRMAAQLVVPVAGSVAERVAMNETEDVVILPVRIHTVQVVRNDINEADECTIGVEFNDAPVDPRVLQSARGGVWIGEPATPSGGWSPSDDNLQFAGVVTNVSRELDDDGWSVELQLKDFTVLFIESKPYPPEGIPHLNMTLSQAWAFICDHTGPLDEEGNVVSTVAVLREAIQFEGEARDVVIGAAQPARFRSMGATVFPRAGSDAWAIWQDCVRACGLVSFIRLNQCIVTTATDYYTARHPPHFVLGQNVANLREDRQIAFAGKGISVLSFDPLTGTTIEGLYPPIGDARVKKKKIGAGRFGSGGKGKAKAPTYERVEASEERTVFNVAGFSDQTVVDAMAKRVWEERSRQELEGKFTTSDLVVPVADYSAEMKTLDLRGGDVIALDIQPAVEACADITDIAERISRLKELGFSDEAAIIAARNLADLGTLGNTFYVKTMTIDFAEEEGGGRCDVSFDFQNRYDPRASGNAEKPRDNLLDAMKDPTKMRAYVDSLSPDEALALLNSDELAKKIAATTQRKP